MDTQDPSPTNVLLVEDDPDVTEQVEFWLAMYPGYRLHVATDGIEGYARLSEKPWDVLLVDLHMPGLDGLGLASFARMKMPNLRVVLMTADHLVAAEHARRSDVFDGVLVKPIRPKYLVNILKAGSLFVYNSKPISSDAGVYKYSAQQSDVVCNDQILNGLMKEMNIGTRIEGDE